MDSPFFQREGMVTGASRTGGTPMATGSVCTHAMLVLVGASARAPRAAPPLAACGQAAPARCAGRQQEGLGCWGSVSLTVLAPSPTLVVLYACARWLHLCWTARRRSHVKAATAEDEAGDDELHVCAQELPSEVGAHKAEGRVHAVMPCA